MIIANLMQNVADAQNVVRNAVARYTDDHDCGCREALRNAVLSSADSIPAEARERLALFLDPIFGEKQ